jgi:hypothetical protein
MDIKQLVENIVTDLNGVADFAGALDPALLPFIAIGKAVDQQLPGLATAIDGWLKGNSPGAVEKADLIAQLKVLSDPNLP